MLAQTIYDLREEYESVSGTDLHEFFSEYLGEPSPSGYANLDKAAWRAAFHMFAAGEAMAAWNCGGKFYNARGRVRSIAEDMGIETRDVVAEWDHIYWLESKYNA